MSRLKDQLDLINCRLNHKDTRRVDNVEYRRPSIIVDGRVWFAQMKLKNDNDVRTMFSIFSQHIIKGPIKIDTSLVRYVEDIQKSLIQLKDYKEIKNCMDRLDEDLSLVDPWFFFCVFY